jgi:hypothetical protein
MYIFLRNSQGDAVCYIDPKDNAVVALNGDVLGFISSNNEVYSVQGAYLGDYDEQRHVILKHRSSVVRSKRPAQRPIRRTAVIRQVKMRTTSTPVGYINALDSHTRSV